MDGAAPMASEVRGVTHQPQTAALRRTRQVETQVAQVCGVLNAAHAQLVELTATVLAEGLWSQAGIVSPAHWLRWKAGLGVAQSEAIVRLASRLAELPVTGAAFGRGELSLDQVKVLTQHVPPSYDAAAATLATQVMVPQLGAAVRRFPFEPNRRADGDGGPDCAAQVDPGTAEPRRVPGERPVRPYLSYGHRDDGSWAISGRLAAEDGAVVEQALDAVRESLFRERRAERGDDRPVEVTGIDRLLRVVDLAAANPGQPRPVRDRFRALVHIDVETLAQWEAGRRPELHLGPVLGRSVLDRLSCDTDIQTVLEQRGLAVAYGPRHPKIPRRIRELIENRDRHCRFPGCGRRRGLEVHHLVHRADGGWTVETNLICLCSQHHHAHHRGEFTITGDPTHPDGLEFRTADGVLIGGPQAPRPHPDPPAGTWRHPPGYRLHRRWFHLEPDPPGGVDST